MTKPKMTRDEAIALVSHFDVPEKVILVGIRAYYKNSMGKAGANDRGIYDDAIFIISDGFYPFNANTDPSVFRKGIAVLKPGVHYYRKGNHGISRPGGGYPALRPATPGEKLPVTRDGEGDSEGEAINIHKGNRNSTSSLGCQTIFPDQWSDFINKVYEEMDRFKQKKIPYILVAL